MKINGSLVFDASSASEIQNLRVEKVDTNPTHNQGSDQGRAIYNTTNNTLYIGSATAWVAIATGGNAAALQTEVDNLETSIGSIVNSSGVFVPGQVTGDALTGSETSITEILQSIANYATNNDTLGQLDDVTLTAPADNDLLQYNSTTSVWENKAIGVDSGVQAYDAGLAALAAFNTNGILVQTANDTFAGRSLVQPAAGITITNANGVSGNPTFALANDLAALEGLATNGYVVRTGDGTATTRSIAGNSGRIVVTNGDGVASDTSIDLDTVSQAATGSFVKVTIDGYGRVTGNTPVVAGDITALVDAAYVNTTGDTMSGTLNMGNNLISGLAPGASGTDAVNKNQLDAAVAGLSWKQAVRAATTVNVDLATALENGDSLDGVTLVTGDRVLVKNQTAPEQNGIYIVQATGAAVRSSDMDTAVEFTNATVFVAEGSVNADTGWTQIASVSTVGTDGVSFAQFTGSGTYVAGVGLALTGNTFDVNLGAGIFEGPSDAVGIDLFNATTGAIILTDDGTTRASPLALNSKLHLMLDAAGGLDQGSAGLFIKADGVTNAMLVNEGVSTNADSGTGTLNLGGNLQIIGDSVQGIVTSVSGSTFTVTASNASTTQKGTASFDTNHFTVTAGAVSLAASLDDLTNVSTADAAATNSLLQKSAGDWIAVSPAAVAGTMLLGDLSDVGTATPSDGHVLVGNGTSWNNQKVYHLHDQSSAATTWSVTHNLGQMYCNVTVVDATDEVVIPQSITFDDANSLTVTFNSAIAGKVVVMGIA